MRVIPVSAPGGQRPVNILVSSRISTPDPADQPLVYVSVGEKKLLLLFLFF
jgi:hypothetical protein